MKNKYEVRDDHVAIFLNHKGDTLETLVSLEDFEKANSIRLTWVCYKSPNTNTYYVLARTGEDKKSRKQEMLHRFILDPPADKVVDHINHDTLDNRRTNLRITTQQQNLMNKIRPHKNKVKGKEKNVYWHPGTKKWFVRIKIHGKQLYFGHTKNYEEAVEIARRERVKYVDL